MTDTANRPANAIGLLLAAGRGSRFDPSGRQNKLLQSVDGKPVVVHAANNLMAADIDVVAVVPAAASNLAKLLEGVGVRHVVASARAHEGMGCSLADGVQTIMQSLSAERILIALGDMPFINPVTHRAVISAVDAINTIGAPEFDGQRGHPVCFWHSHFGELSQLTRDNGARQLLSTYPVTRVAVDDPGVLTDIDRPEDLANH